MAGHAVLAQREPTPRVGALEPAAWVRSYLRRALLSDAACALVAGAVAVEARFGSQGSLPRAYLAVTAALPVLWCAVIAAAGGYDSRFIGVGSEEFRRVLNGAVSFTAGVAIFSYAFKLGLARGYLAIAMPMAAVLDLVVRHRQRKRLHKSRGAGRCMHRVVLVGHAPAVADMVATLRRDSYHGLSVVGACLLGGTRLSEIAGAPVFGGLGKVTAAVALGQADTVAVLACPEMTGLRLRELAWDLEKTGTDLCVAPTLLDVAGPRTTIRPVAGLPLLHVDHPELTGGKLLVKGVFDRVAALAALALLSPALVVIALAIRAGDHGPVFFRQRRVGKDGSPFTLVKFRSMAVDAEQRKTGLEGLNDGAGVLFKLRADPRVTRVGGLLRRWSLDEVPQLFNVLAGQMSLVGPRPALPAEVARYGDHMRRRLAVKPGMTGLWQVSGRSDLSWEEAMRLDIRYVENWSLALDLQILWKTRSAVVSGSGAY